MKNEFILGEMLPIELEVNGEKSVAYMAKRNNLWCTVFGLDSLSLINRLSGLVDVVDVVFHESSSSLVFFLLNKDETGILFKSGALQGTKLSAFTPSSQPLMV